MHIYLQRAQQRKDSDGQGSDSNASADGDQGDPPV